MTATPKRCSPRFKKRPYRAVFFDAAGTLFHPYPSVGELYARTAERYGVSADARDLEENFQREFARRGGMRGLEEGATPAMERAWWRDLVRDVFQGIRTPIPFDAFFNELYELFAGASAWRFYPEVPKVLEDLSEKGLVLGIVSNWDSRLPVLCERLGLSSRIRFVLASSVVGSAKPQPRIFEEALRRAGVAAQDALHVGDSLEEDVQGARAAGMSALFLSRKGVHSELIPTIGSLDEIWNYLA